VLVARLVIINQLTQICEQQCPFWVQVIGPENIMQQGQLLAAKVNCPLPVQERQAVMRP